MKKLAKLSAVFAAIFMLFAFVACSSSSDDDDGPSVVSKWSYEEEDSDTLTFYDNGTYQWAEEGYAWEKGEYSGDTTKAGATITLTPTWDDSWNGELEDPYKMKISSDGKSANFIYDEGEEEYEDEDEIFRVK